jgi:HEAT repeat protein
MMSPALTDAQSEALALMGTALELERPGDAGIALIACYRAGLHPDMGNVLIRLVEQPWHASHEDAVQALQRLQCPDAVDALERTAHSTYCYLDFDENFGLARKCTWALADIGTSNAQRALERLAKSANPLIAGFAQKRLDRWQDELARKPAESKP